MKKILFLLIAVGGMLFATVGEANADHNRRFRRGYSYGVGNYYRGGGLSISINRGFRSPYSYGFRSYPIRRGYGFGYSPRIYGGGFYHGRRFYGRPGCPY